MNIFSSRATLFIIFAVSGFSGLIYESIWTHYLKLFLGHAAYAQSLVLAIFMGGMAIGALLCSRYGTRWKNLLLGYAICEALIGISALLFHDLFNQILELSYQTIFPLLGSYMGITTYKWTLAALLILPQSILLGMTFPLMSAGILRRHPDTPGASIAMLYFCNSLGGAIGVLASGFILINQLGLPGTIMFAGIINLLLASGVWLLSHNDHLLYKAPQQPTKASHDELLKPLLLISLLTGAASFIYEISWIRMLSMVLGSSNHAFELMLSAFIFGLALGGLLIRRYIDRLADSVQILAWVQIAMGLLAISTLILYGNTFELMKWLLEHLEKDESGYLLFNIGSHAIAMLIMLPTTICAGMTLPLITYTLLRRSTGESAIGAVYSCNTLGAIIGVLFAVHIGLPLLGLKDLMIFAAAIDILLGLYLLHRYSSHRLGLYLRPMVALLVLALSITMIELDTLKMASGVFRKANLFDEEQARIIDHQDGKTASISMYENAQQVRTITTNGKPDASVQMNAQQPASIDEYTMITAAALPMFIKPDAKLVANIGLGSGLSSQVFLSNPHIERLDNIEIERTVVEVAKGFSPYNDLTFHDPRSHIHIEDAKTFFSGHQLKYDIILSEPSNPWVSGVASLFSEEFYGLVKRHLNKDGIFTQWIQLYEIEPQLIASIIKALNPHFPYFVVYAPNESDMIIIASEHPQNFSLTDRLLSEPQLAEALARIDIHTLADMEMLKIANQHMLMPLINHYTIDINSDYHPVLDQAAAKSRFLNHSSYPFISLAYYSIPLLETLGVHSTNGYAGEISFTQRHHQVKYNAFVAQQIHHGLTTAEPNSSDSAQRAIYHYRMLLQQCRLPRESTLIAELHRLALLLLPTLSTNEMEDIWAEMINPTCVNRWSESEQQWLQLVIALGARQAHQYAPLAQALLEQKTTVDEEHKQFLLASTMLGRLALQQPEKVISIWRQYSPAMFEEQIPLIYSLLLAHAKQASQENNVTFNQ